MIRKMPNAKIRSDTTRPQPRVLVVDDVRLYRIMLNRWINELGYACQAREDGRQAWKAYLAFEPHLVVTDLDMPGGNGLELIRRIRDRDRRIGKRTPIAVMSSLRDSEMLPLIRRCGADTFLSKPLEKQASLERITQMIRVANDHDAAMGSTPDGVSSESSFASTIGNGTMGGTVSPILRKLYGSVYQTEWAG